MLGRARWAGLIKTAVPIPDELLFIGGVALGASFSFAGKVSVARVSDVIFGFVELVFYRAADEIAMEIAIAKLKGGGNDDGQDGRDGGGGGGGDTPPLDVQISAKHNDIRSDGETTVTANVKRNDEAISRKAVNFSADACDTERWRRRWRVTASVVAAQSARGSGSFGCVIEGELLLGRCGAVSRSA